MTAIHRAGLVLGLAVALASTGCLKLDFMFFPGVALDEYALPDNHIPEDRLEQVSFETAEGEIIYGYWAYSDTYPQGTTILYCHGNNANLDEYWDRVMLMWDRGYTVFVYDYPGYGLSTGTTTEEGLFRSADEAHFHVTSQLAADTGRPADAAALDVVYYGWSLGSAPAVYLAADVQEPVALITEAAMANGQAFVDDSTGLALPYTFLTNMNLDNLGRIPRVDAPKLLIHGEQDDYIAPYFSQMLYDAADQPKQLWFSETAEHGNVVCDGATHDCEDAPEESYWAWSGVMVSFLDEARGE